MRVVAVLTLDHNQTMHRMRHCLPTRQSPPFFLDRYAYDEARGFDRKYNGITRMERIACNDFRLLPVLGGNGMVCAFNPPVGSLLGRRG